MDVYPVCAALNNCECGTPARDRFVRLPTKNGSQRTRARTPAPETPKAEAKPVAKAVPEVAMKPNSPAAAGTISGSGTLVLTGTPLGVTLPAPPKVSSFAPADDLVVQLPKYIKELEKATATEADYKDDEEKVGRDANTVILIALALGLHDQDNKYQASAPAIVAAAEKVAAAKGYAACKEAIATLKSATRHKAGAGELKWAKVASLPLLMKQVPLINTKLKRAVDKKRKEAPAHAAVLAVIAQGSMANVSETKKPGESAKWFEFCGQMRDQAAAVNAALHAGDSPAAAMEKLQKACEDCHAVFHPKEEKK